MELKVWVEGIQRIVSGATEDTTCQDVVFALAHATGRTGRFTLTERWRNNERLLAPQERPVQVLMKWGEYSNDVQFILQHSPPTLELTSQSLKVASPSAKSTDSRKVNGNSTCLKTKQSLESMKSTEECSNLINTSHSKISCSASSSDNLQSLGVHPQHPYNNNRTPPSYRDPPDPSIPHRSLPPYRDPPPPKLPQMVPNVQKESDLKVIPKRNLFRELQNEIPTNESMIYSPQYRDLVRLINYQRDKISAQQAELTKYDAEVMYWEAKTKEQQTQLESLAKETAKVDAAMKHADEQIKFYGQIEQELDITRQQDRTVKSELTLVRSKLANCETELLLCKNKIRLLIDEIETEQRILCRENEERNHVERSMLAEVDRLQSQLEQTRRDAEMAARIGDTIRNEVTLLETTISEKKRQVEKLVADMKEANLQSLAMSPPDELKLILEGAFKPGSSRKMVGSPRQLENALPTSKNPHGVWV